MIHSRQYWGLVVFCIVLISKSNARNIQRDKEDGEGLPSDFMSFVKGLDSMVFQSERKKNTTVSKPVKPIIKRRSQRLPIRRYNNDIKASQTAAIQDILMLKLVSYYEDKYNVARTKVYSTPRMLEPLGGRRVIKGDSIEKTARLRNARKSASLSYTENAQDNNALDPNSQGMKPMIEEVVVL